MAQDAARLVQHNLERPHLRVVPTCLIGLAIVDVVSVVLFLMA